MPIDILLKFLQEHRESGGHKCWVRYFNSDLIWH